MSRNGIGECKKGTYTHIFLFCYFIFYNFTLITIHVRQKIDPQTNHFLIHITCNLFHIVLACYNLLVMMLMFMDNGVCFFPSDKVKKGVLLEIISATRLFGVPENEGFGVPNFDYSPKV